MQRTSPLHMKVVLDRIDAQDRLSDTPTQEFPAVKPPLPELATSFVIPQLPRDRAGRPCVRVCDPGGYTLELVQSAVRQFIEVQGCAPVVILLTAWRWLEWGRLMGYYYPHAGQPIPYGYEPTSGNYDVLARGAFDGN